MKDGSSITENTAHSLDEAHLEIEQIAGTMKEVQQEFGRQTASLDQILQGVVTISSDVQKNAVVAQEGAAASEQLLSHANLLKSQMDLVILRQMQKN